MERGQKFLEKCGNIVYSKLSYTESEIKMRGDFMDNFNLIAGYEKEKKELRKICDVLNNREYYMGKGAKIPKGLILYGSAGNGKTLFTKVLARECDLPVYIVDTADAKDESSIMQQIKNAFDKANDSDKCSVVFFDEIDKFLPDLDGYFVDQGAKTILAQLLTLIDGINSTNNVFFVATCNDFDDLPTSMVRPGRIDKKIMLQNPDYGARKEIAEKYMFATKCEFEMSAEDIAELTQGLSCSAIETLINACVLESDAKNFVSTKTIYKNANEIRYCDIERDFSDEEKYMKSCYNLGRFVVARSFKNADYTLDMDENNLCNSFFKKIMSDLSGNYNDDDYDDEEFRYTDGMSGKKENVDFSMYFSAMDFENTISVLLGGMAAQKVFFGKTFDNTYYDLVSVDKVLFNMAEYGMFGVDKTFFYNRHENMPYSKKRIDALNEKFDDITRKCYETAEKIVTENRGLIEFLQPVLIREEVIKKNRAEELVREYVEDKKNKV